MERVTQHIMTFFDTTATPGADEGRPRPSQSGSRTDVPLIPVLPDGTRKAERNEALTPAAPPAGVSDTALSLLPNSQAAARQRKKKH